MATADSASDTITEILGWLGAEPADDPVDDLAALRERFPRLSDSALPLPRYQHCIEAFDARALDVSDRFKPRLLTTSLPLPHDLHRATSELVEALLDVAGGYQRLIDSARERWAGGQRSTSPAYAARALRLVGEVFLLASMSGGAVPGGLWRRTYGLMEGAGLESGPEGPVEEAPVVAVSAARSAGIELKRLAALAVAQPESLTARELAWTFDYLEGAAGLAAIPGGDDAEGCPFWIDPGQDAPPVAAARRQPPRVDGLLYFSALELSRRAAEQVETLEERISEAETLGLERDQPLLEPGASGLPLGLTPVEVLSLLRRLRDRWASPPMRGLPRQHQRYPVQVCAGLRAIWEMCRSGGSSASATEWMVYNDGPGGFAITCVAAQAGTLSAGMVLAVSRGAGQPWSICIVRWIRSDDPAQVEVGLQTIAEACTPVSIGFRGTEARTIVPALILPPLPALRGKRAILAPAGTYASRRFVLVHEGEHLYVAQGRVLSLDLQTSAVEVFQYEIDPYPI